MKVLVLVALTFLGFVACTDQPARERDADRNNASPIDVGSSLSGDPPCEPQSRDLSYGKTIPGLWLEEIIVGLGAPGGHPAARREIRDTGTALWIDIPAYRKGSIVLAYPGAGSDIVAWPEGIIDWLDDAVDRAEQSPPQCRGSIN